MSAQRADRNLLFGVLAVQMDFISPDQLVGAMHAWMLAKTRPLGEILVEQGALTPTVQALLDNLVDEHVQKHSGDVLRSLRSLRLDPSVVQNLRGIADPEAAHRVSELPALVGTVDYHTDDSRNGAGPPSSSAGQSTSAGTRFQVLRFHAEGGLGIVSVALDTELNREVAFKEIKGACAADARRQGRFVLEAQITGGLEHPAIVPVYGFGRHPDGRPFYAMRFIRGRSLEQAIQEYHADQGMSAGQRNLAFRELLRRFTDVCRAVEYAHSRGVLHRDIKPANVMLGRYGETLVVDWGLAKATGAAQGEMAVSLAPLDPPGGSDVTETLAGVVIGTPQYMPPEQAEGRLDLLSPRSDVYALGATLVTLLTGESPVEGERVQDVLANVRAGEVVTRRPAPPGVPRPLWAICARAMARDPRDRYASAEQLSQEVERFLADEPVSAMRDPLPVRVRRWMRKHPGLTAAGLVTALLVLVFLAVGFGVVAHFTRELSAAHAEAVSHLNAAREARDQAEENFNAARDAVERYLVLVTEDRKLREADFSDLRKALLKSAEPFFERLRDQKPGDREVEASRAHAFFRLANIQRETGELEQARRNYEESIAVYERLNQDSPAVPSYRFTLAGSHTNLGVVHESLGQREEAKMQYEKALAIQEELTRDFPAVPEYRMHLAGSHNNLGVVLQFLGLREEARKHYENGLAIQEQLARDFPKVPQYRNDLAMSHTNLASLHLGLGQREEARKRYEKALAIREQLARDFPGNPDFRHDLAKCHINLGLTLERLGEREEPRKQYEKALAIQEQLARDFPNVPKYRQNLAWSYGKQGALHERLREREEARKQYEKALAIQEQLARNFPEVPEYRNNLAGSHNNLGLLLAALGQREEAKKHYEKALAIREQLARDFPSFPQYKVELAGSYCNHGNLLLAENPAASLEWYGKAEALLKPVLDTDPRHTAARHFLRNTCWGRAEALDGLARFAEAARDWQRAAELDGGEGKATLTGRAANSLARAERAKAFEQILAGDAEPKDADERIALAEYCGTAGKRLYLTSARQYQEAFGENPALADPSKTPHRYNAACCAVLAGSGKGNDSGGLTAEQQARWRRQALDWLRADLEVHATSANSTDAGARQQAAQYLRHWLQDRDLAGVRDPGGLDKLPEEERKEWQAFWQAVRKAVTP